jgi:predicted ribosome quality control (RQC) complex YloA/Tae2 family protein
LAKWASFEYIVDNSMLSNYHTLGYIASLLHDTLRGRRISQIFTQNSDEMVIAFEPDAPVLVFSCQVDTNTVYLHDRFARARSNSATVLADAVGRTIAEVLIHPADRVIILALTSGNRLLLQFFGARANALLVDAHGIVVDTFLQSRRSPGTAVSERTAEVLYDIAALPARLHSSGTAQLAPALRAAMPTLGTTLTRELLYRVSLPPATRASTLDSGQIAHLIAELRHLLEDLTTPRCRVYSDAHGVPTVFSLIPLRHLTESHVREFDDPHAALRFFVGRRRAATEIGEQLASLRTPLRQQRDRLQRTLCAMEDEARESERADAYERLGHLLLAHLAEIRKGDTVALLDGDRIPLDRALTPARNAQHFFEKAKRSRTAAVEKAARIGPARQRLATAVALLEKLDDVFSAGELHLFQQENAPALELLGLSEKAKKRAEIPFRMFAVDGGFEVWVGKSSQNNDLLTLHHAKPADLWFHARGSSGSHVILKVATGKGTPGKRAMEQAAAIAAYFSKMKTASVVPVAMTERKYVRKPKGAPAGTVVIERERVLFVAPGLPPDPS